LDAVPNAQTKPVFALTAIAPANHALLSGTLLVFSIALTAAFAAVSSTVSPCRGRRAAYRCAKDEMETVTGLTNGGR
jgi:hypothetical protein